MEVSDNKSKITEYYEIYAAKIFSSLGLVQGDKIQKSRNIGSDFEVAKRNLEKSYLKQKSGDEIVDWRESKEFFCKFSSE